MNRHLIRASTNVVIVKDGKILLSRRAHTGWADGMLCLPGGHIEPGEAPRDAAQRELKEEVGLEVSKERLEFCCVAQRKGDGTEYVAYEFILQLNRGEDPINCEPEICDELIWVNVQEIPEDIIPDFRKVIETGYANKVPYLELGYE